MIQISDAIQAQGKDIQQALLGMWGTREDGALTELALGSLSVRIFEDTDEVTPQESAKGYIRSLLVGAYDDGGSVIVLVNSPMTLPKKLSMGLLVARQTL
jgi:hypothetical protein